VRRVDLLGLAGAAVALLALSLTLSGSRLSLLTFIGLFAISAIGLSLLGGYAGQISLGHAAYYGIGAYTSALLGARYDISPWLGLPAAMFVSGGVAALVGLPLLQLRGHYLSIGTLAFGIITTVTLNEWRGVTGGPSGFGGIPGFAIGDYELTRRDYCLLIWAVALVAAALALNLVNSRVGRILRAIRGSELAVATLGVAVWRYKLGVFVISAVYAGAAGALYAAYLGYVSPSAFTLRVSVELLTMAAVGGLASIWGAIIGAATVQVLIDQIRDLLPRLQELLHLLIPAVPAQPRGEQELIAFGLLLLIIMIFAPGGIAGGLNALARRFGARRGGDRGVTPAPAPGPGD
jgi:branched-chain amino acid transport system permease protein